MATGDRLTEEEYRALVAARPTWTSEFRELCQIIKVNHGGKFPEDWFERVVAPGSKFEYQYTVVDPRSGEREDEKLFVKKNVSDDRAKTAAAPAAAANGGDDAVN